MPIVVSQYIFGNSLIHHPQGGSRANVPFWLAGIARQAGVTYATGGEDGTLIDFASRSGPLNEWRFRGVRASVPDRIDAARLSSVVIAPENAIQNQPPRTHYPDETLSPVTAALSLISDVQITQPGARFLIYQGSPGMSPFAATFPPEELELAEYHAYALGDYTDWFEDLAEAINEADPDAAVEILPVGAVIAELCTGLLRGVPARSLFADDHPHGTETYHFLAGLITFAAETGLPVPQDLVLPKGLHPEIERNYGVVARLIDERVASYVTPRPAADAPGDEPSTRNAGGAPDPAPAPAPAETPSAGPASRLRTATIAGNEALVLNLAGAEGAELLAVGEARHGTTHVRGGVLTYRPDPGFAGEDRFVYFLGDGSSRMARGEVTVTVTAARTGEAPGHDPLASAHTGSSRDPVTADAPAPGRGPVPATAPRGCLPESNAIVLPACITRSLTKPPPDDLQDREDLDLRARLAMILSEVALRPHG